MWVVVGHIDRHALIPFQSFLLLASCLARNSFVRRVFLCPHWVLVDVDHLDVDLVQPDLLLGTRRVGADPQNVLHLLISNEQDVSGDKESDSLGTGRARQGSYYLKSRQYRRWAGETTGTSLNSPL